MKKILVVDDDKDMHSIYEDIFSERKKDYRLISAFNVNDALKTLKKEKIDLIILDIIMEPISGSFLYLKVMKDKEGEFKKPAVIISSILNERKLPHFTKTENVVILEKPLKPEIILRRVDELIGKAHAKFTSK